MADSAPGWLERGWRALGRTPSLVSAMAVLSLGLVVSSSVLIKGFRQANDSITVTGASTERIRSDAVDWTLEVRQGVPVKGTPTRRCCRLWPAPPPSCAPRG
ncbi:hypothetical protein [Cyanobium sp. ATX-6F1]|uniref:hypothetical protein n=1 Tax=Cyanobium sp. ATX-6F1 TaxID=3137388 RepID=UPI0039BDC49B